MLKLNLYKTKSLMKGYRYYWLNYNLSNYATQIILLLARVKVAARHHPLPSSVSGDVLRHLRYEGLASNAS